MIRVISSKSRKLSLSLGIATHHGRPCAHCQTTEKYSLNGSCITCSRAKTKARVALGYFRARNKTARRHLVDFPKHVRREVSCFNFSLRKYGLTREGFDACLIAQSGRCGNAQCRVPLTTGPGTEGRDDSLCLDHHAETQQFRGLLCRSCNRLAKRGMTREFLLGLADYLEGAA